jgi:hypothetical protein
MTTIYFVQIEDHFIQRTGCFVYFVHFVYQVTVQ